MTTATAPAPITLDDAIREYLMTERQALLLRLETVERLLSISPRVSEIRKAAKENGRYHQDDSTPR